VSSYAYREVESKIFEKELKRYKEIASSSINPSEAFNLINEIEEKKGDKL